MRKYLLIAAAFFGLLSPAVAADSSVPAMTAGSAVSDTDLLYCAQSAGTLDRKCTPLQLSTYIFGKVSGDLTCVAGGACTLKSTGPGATGPLGSTTTAPVVTIDAQGRVTALTSATIALPSGANPTGTAGPAAVNGVSTSFMRADGAPAVQKGTNAQFGIVEGDGTTITCVLGVCSSIGGGATGANPTATAGPAAINGVATTFMRSDASPAVQKASNTQFGLMEGDGSTINCVAGVCTATTGGGGSVTTVSVVTANGVSGTVATATSTPAITLSLGAITPSSVNGNTVPTASDTVALLAATQTLSNKTLVAPALGTPASGVATNLTGTAAGLTAGNVTTNANMTGDVTSVGNATTLTNAAVIAKVLTGYVSGAGTVSAADSILSAIQKINGNDALKLPLAGGTMSGNIAMGGNAITGGGAITGTTITGTTYVGLPNGTNAVKGVVEGDGSTITCVAGVCSSIGGGSGTVTSVSAGCGTTTGGSPITTTGTVAAAITRRLNSTTTDALVSTDCGNLVAESNASSIAVSIAQAGTTGFAAGTYFEVCNIGVGTATITPTTSTIGGASTYALPGGTAAAPVCAGIQSDGTNYNLVPDWTSNASLLASGTVAAARGGAGTITGALKGSGAGVVSQAACADLTNGTALCSTTPGTGVAAAAAVALSGNGGLTSTIASGATAMGTGAISSATCATVVTATATGTATTDVLTASFNGDPSAVTGYIPATAGMLTILAYPTANTANFKVCNNTSSSITPGAITLNWRVVR